MSRLICTTSLYSLGATFVDWTINFLSGKTEFFNVKENKWLPVSDNPLTAFNAHGHKRSVTCGNTNTIEIVKQLQNLDSEFVSFYANPIRFDQIVAQVQDASVAYIKEQVNLDYAQMLQINSQYGISPFNEGNYVDDPAIPNDNPIYISKDNNGASVFGLFYTSYPESRDLISPRRIDRNTTGSSLLADYLGTKSQLVPFYQWKNTAYTPLGASAQPSIFGSDQNTWYTNLTLNTGVGIVTQKYQELDRLTAPFFIGNNGQIENKLGYIFQRNADGDYVPQNTGGTNYATLTSAPWYFYFGLKTGASAMDKFRQLYIGGE